MGEIITGVCLVLIFFGILIFGCPKILNQEILYSDYQKLVDKTKDYPRTKELMKFSLEDGKITVNEKDEILFSLNKEKKLKAIEEIEKK